MSEQRPENFLQLFFSDMRTQGDWPLLYDKQGEIFHYFSKREAALQINVFARALYSCGIVPGDRIAFHANASSSLWLSEWGVLASRAIAVIVPRTFTGPELLQTLAETRSKCIIVDRLSDAQMIADSGESVPSLTHIICMQGGIRQTGIPIKSWSDFRDSGLSQPDRSAALLRSIAAKDTAILFYRKTEDGRLHASRYTHALLMKHAREIDTMLAREIVIEGSAIPIRYRLEENALRGHSYAHPDIVENIAKSHLQPGNNAYIRNVDTVLCAISWDQITAHIMSCYVPVLKEAAIQITSDTLDVFLFGNRPHVIVGSATYFDHVRQYILKHIQEQGVFESRILTRLLDLSKFKYETTEKLPFWKKLEDYALQVMIVKKVLRLLGGRLRLLIGVDSDLRYDTQLFFFAFGIDLVELTQDNMGE